MRLRAHTPLSPPLLAGVSIVVAASGLMGCRVFENTELKAQSGAIDGLVGDFSPWAQGLAYPPGDDPDDPTASAEVSGTLTISGGSSQDGEYRIVGEFSDWCSSCDLAFDGIFTGPGDFEASVGFREFSSYYGYYYDFAGTHQVYTSRGDFWGFGYLEGGQATWETDGYYWYSRYDYQGQVRY